MYQFEGALASHALNWQSNRKGNLAVSLRTQRELDSLDWKLLQELQTDARLSYNELARRVGLSAPAVAERVRRMEDAGVIAAYRAEVDPAKIGLPVTALVQLRCDHGKCLLKTGDPAAFPEVMDVHKVSGPYCTVLKVVASSTAHLESFFERLGQHGEMQTTMVWSTPLSRKTLNWEDGVPDVPAPSEWE